jgi:hypothetical protein
VLLELGITDLTEEDAKKQAFSFISKETKWEMANYKGIKN